MNVSFVIIFVLGLLIQLKCSDSVPEEVASVENELSVTIQSVFNTLIFMKKYVNQLNLDAFFGVTLAQAQLEQALQIATKRYRNVLYTILERYKYLVNIYKLNPNLFKHNGVNDLLFKNVLLNSSLWRHKVHFRKGALQDFGLHSNWTTADILKNKSSAFHGVSTDRCIVELITNKCEIGSYCKIMMMENRNDTLYLLTHRLLFMQLARGIKCTEQIESYTKRYCSLIWRDAKTIEYMNFPNTDIFLEQMLLCGMEGYEEFLINRWRQKPIIWQTEHGCYKDFPTEFEKSRRTANVIEFGCVDHTTSLGLAVLSLNLRYLIHKLSYLYYM